MFSVAKQTSTVNAKTNKVYVNSKAYLSNRIVMIKNKLFFTANDDDIPVDQIYLNRFQREALMTAYNDTVKLLEPDVVQTDDVVFELSSNIIKTRTVFKTTDITNAWKHLNVPLNIGMKYILPFNNIDLILECKALSNNLTSAVTSDTTVYHYTKNNKFIIIEGDEQIVDVFKDFSFEDIGVGGLDEEFQTIFRRVFASRIYPPSLIKKLGIQHVKGVLLYGPPGTGKTLLARQIGKLLNCVEPKIVNGPEIFDKMVGESEKNIRRLFEDAEKDEAENGDNAQLHLIIMDEIDSICKKRGSTNNGTGVNDQVVNQLLTKIDGVNALNDVLLIGMTNRIDLIDGALLRPGRLELQIEIKLPNEEGRKQIFHIHTKSQKANNLLSDDVDIDELARMTSNYTGAEIAGVVRSAASFALFKNIDINDVKKTTNTDVIIDRSCFMKAIDEIRPEFGVEENVKDKYVKHGIIVYNDEFRRKLNTVNERIELMMKSSMCNKQVFLVHAAVAGCGISSFAVNLATNDVFDFVRVISAEKFIGISDEQKSIELMNVFMNARKAKHAAIVVDNIERLIGFSPVGYRFSNNVLQTVLTLMNAETDNKLIIFITTNQKEKMNDIGLTDDLFDIITELKPIDDPTTICKSLGVKNIINEHLPIKKLIGLM